MIKFEQVEIKEFKSALPPDTSTCAKDCEIKVSAKPEPRAFSANGVIVLAGTA